MASTGKNTLRIGHNDAKNWCRTICGSVSDSFQWTIQNFTRYQHKTGEYLQSSTVQTSKDTLEWFLRLYPSDITKTFEEGYVSLHLFMHKMGKKKEIGVNGTFYIINGKGEITHRKKMERRVIGMEYGTGLYRFIKADVLFDEKLGYISDDNLKLYCELTFVAEDKTIIPGTATPVNKVPSYDLSKKIGKLFNDPLFSDVTLNVNGRKIFAHKAILSVGSPVFDAMFRNDIREKNEDTVNIVDISHEILQGLLLFIYTGKVPNLKSSAYSLLSAADKYGLEELKCMCEEELIATTTVENAADVLCLADNHNCSGLKSCTIGFINDNCDSVTKTEGWKDLVCRAPHLVTEAYCSLSDRLKSILSLIDKVDIRNVNN